MTEILRALLISGVPIALIAFGLIYWAGRKGYVIKKESDDLDEEIENITSEILGENKSKENKKHIVFDKWMTFGGGYYGIMAFITYIHVEVMDLYQAFAKFESFQQLLDAFSINFLVGLIIEAVRNFVTAFTWFLYWDDVITINNGWIWIGVTYAAYSLGEKLAEQKLTQLSN
jgi:hypothetical protein